MKISRGRNPLSGSQRSIRNYASEGINLSCRIYKEKQALKEGCKVLDSKRNGSGFFFREVGFQEREENERKDAQSQVEKLFKEYEDSISQILKEFSEKEE